MLILFIFSLLSIGRVQADVLAVEPLQCVDESELLHTLYHAPVRQVPSPIVDQELKRGFLGLFHRDLNPTHVHGNPHDEVTGEQTSEPSLIDPAIIAQINELCPRLQFFYSFAPRHMAAITLLHQQFMLRPTPAEVLLVARSLLNRHEVNPRVWYYALLSTILMRPDLNGYYLAWAVDATPDLYVTNSILTAATASSTRPGAGTASRVCVTATGVEVTDVRYNIPGQLPRVLIQLLRKRRSTNSTEVEVDEVQEGTTEPEYRNSTKSAKVKSRKCHKVGDKPKKRVKRQVGQCHLYNGTNNGATGAENLLWYFREDMMVNHHHWYWHQYFPQSSVRHADRRGEQFYFTHHNLIARYNAERLSNGLPLVVPIDLRAGVSVGSGYNSDIVDSASGRFWSPRIANTPLNDIVHMHDRDFQLDVAMAEIEGLFNTITTHVAQGILASTAGLVDIRNMEGLSHLGNTIEAAASPLNLNSQLYHDYGVHNLGHVAIALSTDPDFRCELPTGVMADLTVTMRDPAFYRIHSLVDEMFHRFKSTLPPYQLQDGEWPLQWNGVHIKSLEVLTGDNSKVNHLNTFWSLRQFPLEEGIDGSIHDGDVEADICHQHLNHEPFTFRLTIDVNSCTVTASNRGTVRIFMAPRFDVNGRRFTMDETRRLMFQLDSFPVELRRGRNTITRNADDSSSTRPWSRSLQDMLADLTNGGQTEYCGCGWPRHLYIPKGSPKGMEFDLFAMVTSYDHDEVLNTIEDVNIQEPCHSPHLFCGIPYRRYPDARPMGYPFDREPYSVVEGGQVLRHVRDLEEYVANVGNAKSSVVIVQHLDIVV